MSVETKLVTGVDFVCVPTRDIAAAMDFYENVLGLEPSKKWQRRHEEPMGAEFEPGTVTIALLNTGMLGIEFQKNNATDRVPGGRCRGRACGARVARRHVRRGHARQRGLSHGEFHDPDGNALTLHHRYAPEGRTAGRRRLGRQSSTPHERAWRARRSWVSPSAGSRRTSWVFRGRPVAHTRHSRRASRAGRSRGRATRPGTTHQPSHQHVPADPRTVEPGRNSPLRRASQSAEHVGGLLDIPR